MFSRITSAPIKINGFNALGLTSAQFTIEKLKHILLFRVRSTSFDIRLLDFIQFSDFISIPDL